MLEHFQRRSSPNTILNSSIAKKCLLHSAHLTATPNSTSPLSAPAPQSHFLPFWAILAGAEFGSESSIIITLLGAIKLTIFEEQLRIFTKLFYIYCKLNLAQDLQIYQCNNRFTIYGSNSQNYVLREAKPVKKFRKFLEWQARRQIQIRVGIVFFENAVVLVTEPGQP